MKRFNFNEFIWFIILFFLTALWGYLILSGDIFDLVSTRMIKYSYFAFVIFAILTIFQISKIVSFPTRNDMSSKFIPLIFTFFMALAYIALNSTYTNSVSILLTEDQVDFYYTGNYISIEQTGSSPNSYNLIKELNADSPYIGKVVSIVGYVNKSANKADYENGNEGKNEVNNENSTKGKLPKDSFLISRDEISCCLQDLSTISILSKETTLTTNSNISPNNHLSNNLENGSWVKALGIIKYENGTPYLDLLELNLIKEPEKKYYTPGV
ncbi:MAG: DUF1980 domain-containing protein [Clostridium sp.]